LRQQQEASKNRESDFYWYGREEESNSNLTAAVLEHRRSEQQEEDQIMSCMKSSAQILKAFNSLEALAIFQRVADSGINGIDNMLLGQSVLPLTTRKQFYMRMAALKQAGLISRTSGKYRLTSLGLVVRSSLRIIDKGIKVKWALIALDGAGAGAGAKQQQQNLEPQVKDILIDKIVTDETIKKILMMEQRQREEPL
jgi:hypothetical protein